MVSLRLASVSNRLTNLTNRVKFLGAWGRLPQSVVFGHRFSVHAHGINGQIFVGDRVTIGDDVLLEVADGAVIHIGSRVWLSRGVVVSARKSVQIGDGTLVGEYSSIRDSNHTIARRDIPILEQGHETKFVEVGPDVWIGRGVAVLAGTKIGRGAVIGANSVVTRDVPEFAGSGRLTSESGQEQTISMLVSGALSPPGRGEIGLFGTVSLLLVSPK